MLCKAEVGPGRYGAPECKARVSAAQHMAPRTCAHTAATKGRVLGRKRRPRDAHEARLAS
eukprot:4260120-Prymnesium_polylepis.1